MPHATDAAPEPQMPAVPAELQQALDARPEAAARWEKLRPSHRREYVNWIAGARQQATRVRRAEKAIVMLVATAEVKGSLSS